jgi:hypothetical protein
MRVRRRICANHHPAESLNESDLSLLKTVNYRESLAIFLRDRRTVVRHDCNSIRSRFLALVPISQPSVAGARARRPATSADRLAAATPSPTSFPFRRPTPLGVALPSVAAGDRGQMASQRFSDLLAVAITLSRTPQDKRRSPRPDSSDEHRQPALGRSSYPRRPSSPAAAGSEPPRALQSATSSANRPTIDLPKSRSADPRCSDEVADDGAAAPTIAGADKGFPQSIALWA